MFNRILKSILILSLLSLVFACAEDEGGGSVTLNSLSGGTSHNQGQNCMGCHTSGGQGRGIFTAAGTIYDINGSPVSDGYVVISENSDGTGNPKLIQVDGTGNFYTTDTINFGGGLYAAIYNGVGDRLPMTGTITVGSCNGCHNDATEPRLEEPVQAQ